MRFFTYIRNGRVGPGILMRNGDATGAFGPYCVAA